MTEIPISEQIPEPGKFPNMMSDPPMVFSCVAPHYLFVSASKHNVQCGAASLDSTEQPAGISMDEAGVTRLIDLLTAAREHIRLGRGD